METDRAGNQIGDFPPCETAVPMTGIQILVHTGGIPAEQLLLFMPGEGTTGGERLGNDGFAFGLEAQQHLLGQCSRQPESDKIRGAFAFKVRQHAARVKTGGESAGIGFGSPLIHL